MENEIFKSLLYIVNFFNNPQNDNFLLKEAGIKNDPNLLPIIVRIGAASSISVGELASQLGKIILQPAAKLISSSVKDY
ncbi:hypothetical protein [Lentilactobacillus kosonis]|uniref:Transcriptional regulator, MarR family n=1 Tax=Lentilactobacillus kosonis TaxID=2810561 RepID=A0A401FNM4_9LACO|nr:hypothetical protein [Lentilactobacillus kosonis]GAY73982.1 transcriptional regulator, MarR family [Lentilactobacillus kosonis]